ncbi:unnamed protein product [Bursaphelenchus xylophilus]|uniref:(pine wood nematode) hypothetical protein n=1 Tax=Bursaphelenchus xylophilus TaxID=6326 RepID=A0A1I7RYA3_BURXY|nr:unnamed protein product [Bursaphelenchus xylophilus]CAG9085510.1 unnamed protein product [Bursaphelenchus xylophilus]
MNRKRTSTLSFKSPLLNRDECDSPVQKKSFVPPVSSATPSIRTQSSRFVSQSYFRQPYKMSSVVPKISTLKPSVLQMKSIKPSKSVESTCASSKPRVLECSFKPADASPSRHCQQISSNKGEISTELQTLDFQTASQAPIKMLASKLNTARSLLRDVDITAKEEAENTNLISHGIQDFPDSLEQDLDIDWASVGRSIEEKLNETV